MSKSIDFYFDFSSAYSYVGHRRIMQLAEQHGATLNWKPIALGAVFKAHGHAPPLGDNAKSRYIGHDVARSASINGLTFQWPKPFPFNSIPAARVFWYLASKDEEKARKWALAVLDASMGQGRDCSSPEVLADIGVALGHDGDELLAATQQDEVKQRLKDVTGEAMSRGVFGAPTFFLDDEMFWGADRIDQLENKLRPQA